MIKSLYVFIDMDGVFCTYRSTMALRRAIGQSPASRMRYLDPIAIHIANWIGKQPKTWFIVTSQWRLQTDVQEVMQAAGFLGRFHTNWSVNPNIQSRGNNIDEWLVENAVNDGDFEYMILDDEESDLAISQRERLIKTDMYNGFTKNNIEEIERVLRNRDPNYKIIEM